MTYEELWKDLKMILSSDAKVYGAYKELSRKDAVDSILGYMNYLERKLDK